MTGRPSYPGRTTAGVIADVLAVFPGAAVVAERRLGEMLRETVPHQGGRKRSHDGTVSLRDLGVSKKDSSRWQREASVPDRRALGLEGLVAFEGLKAPQPAQGALFPLAPSIRPSYPRASASLAPDASHHPDPVGAGAQRTTRTARAAHRLRRTPSAPDTRVAPSSERTARPHRDPRHHIATREAPPLCAEGPRAHEETSRWT